MVNVIQEYLVRLGFDTNDPSISKFNNILITAEAEVDVRTLGGMFKEGSGGAIRHRRGIHRHLFSYHRFG